MHLSSDNKKSMEVFGPSWADYMNRIRDNWVNSITDEDCVILPGDLSWGMYLNESIDDFRYLNDLPGMKLILKGNHDYWWETVKKLNEFVNLHRFNNMFFLYNNSYQHNDTFICGTRGWISPDTEGFNPEDQKIFSREVGRLELSISSTKNKVYNNIIVAMHYPPFDKNGDVIPQFGDILHQYNVSTCIYGHLHNVTQSDVYEGIIDGIEYKLVSADYLGFEPYLLTP